MASFKYVYIATDGNGYTAQGLPGGPDDGKPGLGGMMPKVGTGQAPPYRHVVGGWNPAGLGIMSFDTQDKAEAWEKSDPGKEWLSRYKSVVLAKLLA